MFRDAIAAALALWLLIIGGGAILEHAWRGPYGELQSTEGH